MPYGEQINTQQRTPALGYSTDDVRRKFTSYERDAETGLDYANARYYANNWGRFTTPDPIFTTLDRLIDPQRLNSFAYTRNNPLKFTDKSGLDLEINAKDEEEARNRFALFQKGLGPRDRKATKFFIGDGKKGYAKGKFYILIDKDHESDDENFQAAQAIANDRKQTTTIFLLGPRDVVPVRIASIGEDGKPKFLSFKEWWKKNSPETLDSEIPELTVDVQNGSFGMTNFRLFGQAHDETLYSLTDNNEVYIANNQSDIEIVATMFHELRAHVYLSNMGRNIPAGSHPNSKVNKAAKDAEEKARNNFSIP